MSQCMQRYPGYSKTSIYRHLKLTITYINTDKRQKKGQWQKLDERDIRRIVSSLNVLRETVGNFSSMDIQRNSGISEKEVSNRTIRRRLRKLGYGYNQC